MKVLVTGASGFIGKACVAELQRSGVEVLAIGRHRPAENLSFLECDLLSTGDLSTILQEARPSHLLHLAWYAEHGKYWNSPLNQQWVRATQKLVDAFCAAGGKHAVFAGTCAEYDWTMGECHEGSTPLKPATLYGAAKVEASQITSAICDRHGVRFSWGRIFQPYGPFENSERLVPALIDVFQGRRRPFAINGNFVRDFIYSKDVARAFLTLLESDAAGYYNIASGQPVRLADVAIAIAKACQTDAVPLLELPPNNTSGPAMIVGAVDRLKNLGWAPEISFRQGIVEMLKV